MWPVMYHMYMRPWRCPSARTSSSPHNKICVNGVPLPFTLVFYFIPCFRFRAQHKTCCYERTKNGRLGTMGRRKSIIPNIGVYTFCIVVQ